jgi:hypothetical protein
MGFGKYMEVLRLESTTSLLYKVPYHVHLEIPQLSVYRLHRRVQ